MAEKSVNEIINEVCEAVCDTVCKFRDIYSPTHIDLIDDDYFGRLMDEHCDSCPLKRLVKC